ncbi:MAG: choline-sulfatase [Planctomycetes bacterium]|nr:choline-sulfatase [Planctomycetota bacterium]
MTRRAFLKRGVAATAGALGCRWLGAAPARRERPPNLLVIMSDEHNAGVTGCYGNRLVRTPHLDALAARGVVFESAYTPSPLCVPARLAFTAGKHVSRIGAWSNACWLPSPDYPSLPRILNAAGYESFLCGKQHYDASHRYGFTEIGGNMNNSFMTGLGARRAADDARVNTATRDARFAQFHPGEGGVQPHDRRVTAGVAEFLAKRRRADKPFFLFAGYLAPHFPLIVPEPYWEPYKGKVPMPVLPPGHVDAQPLNYHHLRRGFGVAETDPELVRKGRELYHGLTQWMDEQVGKLLDALARSEAAQDTVVVYTTDHGENMGEHALWWKNCMYEHAARVPLIVSWPERWKGGGRRVGACSLLDLVQTLAELGGAKTPDDWNGTSLCPWLDEPSTSLGPGPKAPWKDVAVSEYYAHNIASGYAMLRTGSHKYVYHTPPDKDHPAQRELYDLAADPGEFTNLAERPEHKARVEQLHAALVKELGEHPDETEQRCRASYAKGYGRAPAPKAKGKGKQRP